MDSKQAKDIELGNVVLPEGEREPFEVLEVDRIPGLGYDFMFINHNNEPVRFRVTDSEKLLVIE